MLISLFLSACASKAGSKDKTQGDLEAQPLLFADWKYKGFGQEYPLWAEAVLKGEVERAGDLLGLSLLSGEAVAYKADVYYGENLDILLKYEDPSDENLIKETWCYLDSYYEQSENKYVYITLRREEKPQGMEE